MDLMVDHQPPPPPPPQPQPTPIPTPTPTPRFKYFCKICKKGFGCGRALGGHMRAHGIGDESLHMNDDDDQAGDWDDKLGGNSNVPPTNRRMYALRTNPNRLKSCRVCENCGKEFLSWKSFLEHGKCACDDVESLVSSPDYEDEDDVARRGAAKRKRSLRLKVDDCKSNCPISEEEDLANCLMMLSNATTDDTYLLAPEAEESCASASREDYERHNYISYVTPISYRAPSDHMNKAKGVATRSLFECKACKKVFNSHQALGGHRASHKKVKGCFAARLDNDYHNPNLDGQDNTLLDEEVITHEKFLHPSKSISALQNEHVATNSLPASKKKSKVHECSICHRIFSSGQALGGHKRCHWITSNAPSTSNSLAKFHQFHDPHLEQQPRQNHKFTPLDLNLPVRRDRAHRLSFELSTEIQLQPPWTGDDSKDYDVESKNNDNHNSIIIDDDNNLNNNTNSSIQNNNMNGTKEDCKVELAKLSDLKDMNGVGSSSPWLQVGIGSTTNIGADL